MRRANRRESTNPIFNLCGCGWLYDGEVNITRARRDRHFENIARVLRMFSHVMLCATLQYGSEFCTATFSIVYMYECVYKPRRPSTLTV